jgi:penicillin-binding protein 1B
VNFLMVDLLQEVMRTGTAAGVRGRGFTLPAAGKTGTSHDGWFAGFTSKLICVVWVGFDDNKELPLEGAKSALPIWTEFMKRAHEHREYRNVQGWDAPDGIVNVDIDPATGQLATAGCPSARAEYFISGSQPVELCRMHSTGVTQVAGWESAPTAKPTVPAAPAPPGAPPAVVSANGDPSSGRYNSPRTAPPTVAAEHPQPVPPEKPKEKKGFFGRIRDIFK